MTKLYNTQVEITNIIREFLKISIPNLRKTKLNIIPEILFGMLSSESVVTTDIAKCLKDDFSFVYQKKANRRALVELFASFWLGFTVVFLKLSVNQPILIGELAVPSPEA